MRLPPHNPTLAGQKTIQDPERARRCEGQQIIVKRFRD
jgi:hypothetical protein